MKVVLRTALRATANARVFIEASLSEVLLDIVLGISYTILTIATVVPICLFTGKYFPALESGRFTSREQGSGVVPPGRQVLQKGAPCVRGAP
jgi:hypothetical protein